VSGAGSESKEVQKSMVCKKLIFETGVKSAGKGLRLRSSVSVKKINIQGWQDKNSVRFCL